MMPTATRHPQTKGQKAVSSWIPLRRRQQVARADIIERACRGSEQSSKRGRLNPTHEGIRGQHAQGGRQGRSNKGTPRRSSLAETTAQKQHIGEDAFRELVQDHTDGGKCTRQSAHREGHRVNDAIDEGMQRNAHHRHEANGVILRGGTIAHEGGHEAIEEMHREIADEHIQRRAFAQAQGLRHDMEERYRNEDASSKAREIRRIAERPVLVTPYNADASGCHRCRAEAGEKWCPECLFHALSVPLARFARSDPPKATRTRRRGTS
jgi:hypothetical protein